MKLFEIFEKLKSDEITLDNHGHRVNETKERLLGKYQEAINQTNGSRDGKWNYGPEDNREKVDKEMREHALEELNTEVHDGRRTYLLSHYFGDNQCFGCGEKYAYILMGNKLSLVYFYNKNKKREKLDSLGEYGVFEMRPDDYRCPFEDRKPFTGSINIKNTIVLANYFPSIADCPEDEEYSNEWSLNHEAGRKLITGYKASQNVAYGQMGNMSVGVYINKSKDSIIIGPSSHPSDFEEYDSDEEYEEACKKPVFEGYKLVDSICLDVWRWEASCLETVKQDVAEMKDSHRDLVKLRVKPGTWTFEQRYRCVDLEKNDYKYAILNHKS